MADDPKARARINAYLFDLERALEEVKDCLQYTERMVRAPTPTGPRTESGPDGYAKLLNSCQDSVDTIRNLEKQICAETGLPSLDLSEVQLIHCKFPYQYSIEQYLLKFYDCENLNLVTQTIIRKYICGCLWQSREFLFTCVEGRFTLCTMCPLQLFCPSTTYYNRRP